MWLAKLWICRHAAAWNSDRTVKALLTTARLATPQDRWPEHVILRSSIIYGPQCAAPVSRTLFLQFIENSLAAGKPTSFFDDEFRCPVYVEVQSHTLPRAQVCCQRRRCCYDALLLWDSCNQSTGIRGRIRLSWHRTPGCLAAADLYPCQQDIIATVRAVISRRTSLQHRVFNMGGPERLSRLDMARKVPARLKHTYAPHGIFLLLA